MKTIVPSYYKTFHCVASECVHNCCREGWEIDLDDAHVELYKKLKASGDEKMSVLLSENLVLPTVKERRTGEVPHIRLKEDGVCPFLNDRGLCGLILAYGEKSICQICTDHPRFRNYYKDQMELGLGLCCEEACRIILNDPQTGCYEDMHTGQNVKPMHRSSDLYRKIEELSKRKLDFDRWAEYLLGLELLEKAWKELLERFLSTKAATSDSNNWERRIENLQEYYLYRYGCKEGIGFASFSVRLIAEMAGRFDLPDTEIGEQAFAEICRLYSSEIEYSEENRKAVADKLSTEGYFL